GEFLRIPDRHEADPQRISQRRGEDEPASFDAQHQVYRRMRVVVLQAVDDDLKPARLLQQCGDVVEEDAWLRKVRDFADEGLEVFHSGKTQCSSWAGSEPRPRTGSLNVASCCCSKCGCRCCCWCADRHTRRSSSSCDDDGASGSGWFRPAR